MDHRVLLEKLKDLKAEMPDEEGYYPTSTPHRDWLARAQALASKWNQFEGNQIAAAAHQLPLIYQSRSIMPSHLQERVLEPLIRIQTIILQAIATLELEQPQLGNQVFPANSSYSFYKALTALTKSAEQELFIIDPYLDKTAFDLYCSELPPNKIQIRLLSFTNYSRGLFQVIKMFNAGRSNVECRVDSERRIHDRVLFLDKRLCWVAGNSIKDAAAKTPTYLIQLEPQGLVNVKLTYYETIWANSKDLQDPDGPTKP